MKAEKSVARALTEAKAAARRGDIPAARDLYLDVLDRFPGNRKARAGLLALDDPGEQDARIARKIRSLHALFNAGSYAMALDGAQAVLKDAPQAALALDLAAACLRRLDRPDEALPIYRARIETDPDNGELWKLCGSTLIEMMRLTDAAECMVMATRLAPDVIDNWMRLANCHQRRGDNPAAFESLTQALGRDPQNPAALDQLGQVLRDMGRTDLALDAHEQALTLSSAPTERSRIEANIGVILSANGDTTGAGARYRSALRTHDGNIHALLNLASLAQPEDLAEVRNRALGLLDTDDLAPLDRSRLHFALFRVLDRAGTDPAEAFDHLDQGNAIRRKLIRYEPSNQTCLFRAIRSMSDQAPQLDASGDGLRPIFIVGLPRSGTTLTEQLLSAAPGVHPGGELTMTERLCFDLMRRLQNEGGRVPSVDDMHHFATELRQGQAALANGAPVLLDKMPLNFRWTGMLLAALPDAHVVHIRRDPIETCWSNFTTSFSSNGNGFVYGLSDLVDYHRLYTDLTDHWARQFPDRIHMVRYEELVSTPEPVMRGLVAACGLDWSDDCLHPERVERAVLTASVHQVRKAIYNGNRGRWRPYTPFISTLLDGFGRADAA
ncbi:MAG: hypothetical protein CML68_00230 [Rhodobacteraceae bacterium]|nr:hypothetical protein [Paracoccaceae bacterium]